MKTIKLFKFFVFLFVFYAINSLACESPKSDAFPAVKTDGGFVVFNNAPLAGEDGQDSDDIAIEVDFVNCADGVKKRIGGLPFLAATGNVKAAFLADDKVDAKPKLFVIHSVEIRADTGVKYLGDYYTVHVYSNTPSGYVRDERLSNYFGVGGDIASDADESVLAYRYPYKTADEIITRINSVAYKKWADKEVVKLTISKKTSIYSSANLFDTTKMYLIKGDSVLQESVEAGWIEIMFKTSKGKEIRGWVQCVNTDGC
ncbi:hypothetical protein ACIPIN_14665 [Pseudomonas sp. NPDC087697]|uniref:hypothetical protein n=1 Tax=Pseudomonas sp. NPDC087697 TaxID=3364447 RepID=UPI00380CE0FD